MIVSSISNAVENYIPVYVTENVLARVRFEFMEVLLRQNIEWFETNHCEEATFCTVTLFCGIVIGFSTSWQLTLVIMGCAPFFAIADDRHVSE